MLLTCRRRLHFPVRPVIVSSHAPTHPPTKQPTHSLFRSMANLQAKCCCRTLTCVSYLKEDSCNAPGDHATAFKEYGLMRDGLNKTGRPILFSLCGWSAWYAPPDPALGYGGGKTLGNSFRIGPDDTNWNGVLKNIDINANLAPYAGPGGWNDPCLLLAETYSGTLRQTMIQTRTQFSMWAVMASPLLISANVRHMSTYNLETYKNKEVIAVNQVFCCASLVITSKRSYRHQLVVCIVLYTRIVLGNKASVLPVVPWLVVAAIPQRAPRLVMAAPTSSGSSAHRGANSTSMLPAKGRACP